MDFDNLTEIDIERLISLPKKVVNPNTRWVELRGSKQINYQLKAEGFSFSMYLRQNTYDLEHFSCGLVCIKPDGQKLSLLRYNGSNHPHGDILYACHIHKATERAIREGKKPDSYAEQTDRYHSLDGALFCLCEDANISGLPDLKADHPDLFK